MENPQIEIREVQDNRQLNEFIKLPWKIYKNDRNWIPPLIVERKEFLNPKKNPFFKHADIMLFIAYKDNRPIGRIASIINHNHNSFHNEKTAFFGLFESIDDYVTAYGLLDKAREFAKSHGMTMLRGPANFSTNEETGLLIDGFSSPPAVMMTYNPQYYLTLFEKFGLKKTKDLNAYYIDNKIRPSPRIIKTAEKIKMRSKIIIRSMNMKKFNEEVELIKRIYNNAWSRNWGFIPMTDEEFEYMAKQLKQIVDPDLVLLAFINDEPAGFALALPNINEILIKLNGRLFPLGIIKLLYYSYINKIIKGLRVITMGVIHKYQKRGIDNLLYLEAYKISEAKGYKWAELSWVLEDNVLMNRSAELLKARLYKKYRIYEMEV